jgi:glycosyltransferase involved in cell wall biosynthesis
MYEPACTGDLLVFHRVLRDQLVAEFGVAPERVHVVPHPLDGSDAQLEEVEPPERPFLLFFGTLRANKGIDGLLAAVEALDDDPPFDVVIAGEGPPATEGRVREVADRCARLRFEPGFVSPERKRQLFSTASAVVLPYRSFSSQSGVLADCYAFRTPPIVTDVGALGAPVRDDDTGWVIPGAGVDELAGTMELAMGELARGRDRRDALDAAAARHDFARVGPMLRSIYDEVVEANH